MNGPAERKLELNVSTMDTSKIEIEIDFIFDFIEIVLKMVVLLLCSTFLQTDDRKTITSSLFESIGSISLNIHYL